jgi:hypothetical protein
MQYESREFHLASFLQYGLGVYFYYEDMIESAFFFGICTALSIPIYAIYASGNNSNLALIYNVEQLSLGNLMDQFNRTDVNIHKLGMWAAVLDFGVCIAFFIFIIRLSRIREKIASEYELVAFKFF